MALINSSITVEESEYDGVEVYDVFINGQHFIISGTPINLNHTISTTVTRRPDITAQWIKNRCLVFHLQSAATSCLVQFLCYKDKFTFVGTAVVHKMTLLKMQFSIPGTIALIDLGFYWIEPVTKKRALLRAVPYEWLVEQNWGRFQLVPPMVQYAGLNAFLNIHIAKWLWDIY